VKGDALGSALEASIAEATRERFTLLSKSPVGGGCIHSAFRIEGRAADASRAYFVKANDATAAPLFEAEADGLAALRESACVTVPRTIARAADDEHAWLVLEWLELRPLDPAGAARLGSAMAALHAREHERFGWERDNFIGTSPQRNGWSTDWVAFFQERRLHAQLRMAAQNRLPSRMIDRGERLLADCPAFFSGHAPKPSLLHGDLWGGNAAVTRDGVPVVFDPAVYVGDREADVAMTALFGGFPPDFLARYRDQAPLHDGYRVRRDLYNLYHRLNHANLFAGGYVREGEMAIERLLAEL
jgi:protein-ribulosamine 3-kinase